MVFKLLIMSKVNEVVDRLSAKVEKLISLQSKLASENKGLRDDIDLLKKEAELLNTKLKKLEEKNKIIKIAKSLKDANEGSTDMKLKINELVREIDKNIALLNR
jgi:outer membrane murein-binding lipoprotein Lpp